MSGWDFSIFWQAGNAVLNGQDPLTIQYFYYPLPFAYFLSIFALLPLNISFIIWLVINFLFLLQTFRKNFWQWLLYVPVLHQFSSGQVELFLWYLERWIDRSWRGIFFAAFITLKPQAAIILLPWHLLDWLKNDRKTLIKWVGTTMFIWGFPMLWRPFWIVDWLKARSGLSVSSARNSPGLFSIMILPKVPLILIILISTGVFLWGHTKNKQIARASATLASPVGLFYSTLQLLGCAPAWILVPASILAVILTVSTKTFIPFMLIPITVIAWQLWYKKSLLKESASTNADRN